MLTFPVRLLTTIALALFCSSRWVRRAVAAVAVSGLIVAMQNAEALHALAAAGGHDGLAATFRTLAALAGNG